jgi:hypothetical protein
MTAILGKVRNVGTEKKCPLRHHIDRGSRGKQLLCEMASDQIFYLGISLQRNTTNCQLTSPFPCIPRGQPHCLFSSYTNVQLHHKRAQEIVGNILWKPQVVDDLSRYFCQSSTFGLFKSRRSRKKLGLRS